MKIPPPGIFHLTRVLPFLLGLGFASVFAPLFAAESAVTVTQITHSPSHHYFGYIGQSRTIPWSAGGRHFPALQVLFQSPPVFMSHWAKGELRLDPAPCWNRTGDAIVVPGIAPDGTRQMYVLTLDETGRPFQSGARNPASRSSRDSQRCRQ